MVDCIAVYSCLGLYPKGVDQVAAETKLDIKDVMELLVTLRCHGTAGHSGIGGIHQRNIEKSVYHSPVLMEDLDLWHIILLSWSLLRK